MLIQNDLSNDTVLLYLKILHKVLLKYINSILHNYRRKQKISQEFAELSHKT